MEREIIIVLEEEIDDHTKTSGSWEIKGETYEFIETFRTDGDGEWHGVIVQRKCDKKYFQFDWGYNNGNYYYEPKWIEVVPKDETITRWI